MARLRSNPLSIAQESLIENGCIDASHHYAHVPFCPPAPVL
jgi:hypothetical protein